jgi:hypothetical protein
LYNPGHDLGLVLYGTKETSNALADRNKGSFTHVTTARTLTKIDQDFYRSLDNLEAEEENPMSGNLVDGLCTALDMINSHCGTKKYKKRVFLITDGEFPLQSNNAEMQSLIKEFNEKGIRLNVITLDFGNDLYDNDSDEEDFDQDENKPMNEEKPAEDITDNQQKTKDFLVKMTNQMEQAAIFPAHIAMEIYQQFNKREVMARNKFRGQLAIAEDLSLNVQVYSRTREEPFPSLKKYSKLVPENQSLDSGKVQMERQYTELEDPDQK